MKNISKTISAPIDQQSLAHKSLIVGAIGIVYGDIGTSPLYALKSCFVMGNLPVNETNILGLISIIMLTLFLIVSIKYVSFVLKVDNHGEGGILALSSLCSKLNLGTYKKLPILLGIIGCGLFFGDGVITPAISILSAVEGLKLISPIFSEHVIWLTILILLGLFYIQKKGSGFIGQFFGPVMIIWFLTIGLLGLAQIIQTPFILKALNPFYAIQFFYHNGFLALKAMGGIFLVVTGAEALYADLGHFGKKSITLSWHYFVLPALLLTYLGQGALLIQSPEAISNPFYLLVPKIGLYPLIILSTIATIIASQAIISGVFSIAWQAIMFNYLPRMKVIHTSYKQIGQVYLPAINTILCIFTIMAILGFRSSENLAVAYGLSVSGSMLITTILVLIVANHEWKWQLYKIAFIFIPFIFLDLLFITTNLAKFFEGAWYAVLLTLIIIYTIRVWTHGNRAITYQVTTHHKSLEKFMMDYIKKYDQRIPGTAIFMTRDPDKVPNSLMIHLRHNKFLHEKLIFVSIITTDSPFDHHKDKFSFDLVCTNQYRINAKFGFKEDPNLHKIIHWAKSQKLIEKDEELSFFLSKGIAVSSPQAFLNGFSENFYIYLSKNALTAYEFYKIPHDKVIELGVRYKI